MPADVVLRFDDEEEEDDEQPAPANAVATATDRQTMRACLTRTPALVTTRHSAGSLADRVATSFAIGCSLRGMETTNLAEAEGLLAIEWSQVEPQLADLRMQDDPTSPSRVTWWLTTLNTDGSAHVTSVGAIWHSGSVWFQTGDRTRKANNIARDPRCTLSVATRGFDVMVAGDAQRVTDPKVVARIAALWAESGWPAEPDHAGTGITAPFNAPTLGPAPWFVYEVKPRTATAVGTTEEVPGSTRWRF